MVSCNYVPDRGNSKGRKVSFGLLDWVMESITHGGKEWQLKPLSVVPECAVAAPHIRAEQKAGRMAPEAETMEQEAGHGCHSEAEWQREMARSFFPGSFIKHAKGILLPCVCGWDAAKSIFKKVWQPQTLTTKMQLVTPKTTFKPNYFTTAKQLENRKVSQCWIQIW